MLIRMPRAIDDRSVAPLSASLRRRRRARCRNLPGARIRTGNGRPSAVCAMPRMLGRHRRSIGNDSIGRVLGDQVGGILGDELIAVHRFDQGVLALFHARREAIERGRQRANFAATLVADQGRDFLVGRCSSPDVGSGTRAGASYSRVRTQMATTTSTQATSRNSTKCRQQVIDREEAPRSWGRRRQRSSSTRGPACRRRAPRGRSHPASPRCPRSLPARDRTARWLGGAKATVGQAHPVRVHDELALAGNDIEVSGLADHRLGNVAQHPRMGEARGCR